MQPVQENLLFMWIYPNQYQCEAIESVLKRGKAKLNFNSELVEEALEGDENKPLTLTDEKGEELRKIIKKYQTTKCSLNA